MEGCRLTGAALTHATISDMAFVDCRLDLASFARTTLERVRFTRCTLEQADLGDATFSSVTFADCSLAGADLMDSQNVPLSRLIAFPRQPRIHSGVRYAIVVNLQNAPPRSDRAILERGYREPLSARRPVFQRWPRVVLGRG